MQLNANYMRPESFIQHLNYSSYSKFSTKKTYDEAHQCDTVA